MTNPIDELRAAGQSVWLDYIRRGLLSSGEFARMVEQGWITGVTSNPTIFQKAIAGSKDYQDTLAQLAGKDLLPYDAFLEIGSEDIRLAADELRGVYDATAGADGYVSFEAQPGSSEAMIAEAQRMFEAVGRPNVMIKIPGVADGPAAVEELIFRGVNVNITLLFEVAVYERFAEAYLRGLERRAEAGLPVESVHSVASFFVSRVDTKADKLLPDGSPLRGKVAIANARKAYRLFLEMFTGPRWERLAAAGASVQRPLWASTGTKNPEYRDVMYVEELVAPETVNTMPEATLQAFLDHGKVDRDAVLGKLDEADEVLREAAEAGIDLHEIGVELLEEGIEAFNADYEKLLATVGEALKQDASESCTSPGRIAASGDFSDALSTQLAELERENLGPRIWRGDHRVWTEDPVEITQPNRLGWLTVIEQMKEQVGALQALAAEVKSEGYETAVLLGMGGSSLAPEVMATIDVGASPVATGLALRVLDTTVPADIIAVEKSIDLSKTLFIVSSKSGTTIETTSQLAYFWDKLPDGRHFVAITDPGTQLASLGRERGFRRVFLNPESIGGRYSALSYFGLVPGALIGIDPAALLESGFDMQQACHYCQPPSNNPGAWLGAVLGTAALTGRDKLTLVLPPEIAALGDWIEQLIAESTGKEGKGIVPVVSEPLGGPEVYGADRLFVAYGDAPELAAIEAAGQPVVHLPYDGPQQLGADFFRWQFATAVAGNILSINPFDQPDVQLAKDAASRFLESGPRDFETRSALELLQLSRPGDYFALLAYLPRTDETRERLAALRLKLRDRYGVATTMGFGPRYLHSTGQIHKGGPNSGIFVQLIDEDEEDVAIPGKVYSFGRLKRAQADGDLEALLSRGRRAVRLTLAQLEEALR